MTLFLECALIAVVVLWVVFILTHKPADRPEPVQSNADWFQTLPWRDFVPVVPRLRMPRLLAPKRRGRHAA